MIGGVVMPSAYTNDAGSTQIQTFCSEPLDGSVHNVGAPHPDLDLGKWIFLLQQL